MEKQCEAFLFDWAWLGYQGDDEEDDSCGDKGYEETVEIQQEGLREEDHVYLAYDSYCKECCVHSKADEGCSNCSDSCSTPPVVGAP